MSLTTLTTEAMEEGSYFITISFYDEDDKAETPNADTIKWTLTDRDGTVINDRHNVSETSATSITIELEGDDLAIQSGETAPIVRRRITVLWEYDSDLGNDKPAKAECIFPLRNLTRLPAAA
jgi:hypothetical protein